MAQTRITIAASFPLVEKWKGKTAMRQAAYLIKSPNSIVDGRRGKEFAGKALYVGYLKWKIPVGMEVLVTRANGLLGYEVKISITKSSSYNYILFPQEN